MRSPRPIAIALLLLAAPGCGLFDIAPPSSDGGHPTMFGFGKPTLEVTVAGVHFGPAPPDPGSAATFVDSRDGNTGRVVNSVLRVNASVQSLGVTCVLDVQRQGDGVAPIGTASYLLAPTTGGATADGTIEPIEGESVVIPQGAFQCTGNGCNGGGFSLTALDATHAEGYLGGAFANTAGAGVAEVVCAFYLPMVTYAP